jgi:hypothetical protein
MYNPGHRKSRGLRTYTHGHQNGADGMRKTMISTALLMAVSCGTAAFAQTAGKSPFIVCKSTYALCTFSACKSISTPGQPPQFSCTCPVHHEEYSAGEKPCQPVKNTPLGQSIKSRYHPIKTYSRCTNNRDWAMCLDSPCIIDKTNPAIAQCICSAQHGQGDYVVKPGTDQCTRGAVSSATVDELDQITDYIQTQPNLLPFNFVVVNVTPK